MATSSYWLRGNEQNRYPRLVACFDSEAFVQRKPSGERHTFRLAAASFDRIDPATSEPKPRSSELADFETPSDLWLWLDGKTRKRHRLVLWALNLGYDLRLTQAFRILPALGWHLKAVSFGARSCWCHWSRDTRSLVMVDLFSFLPRSLERLGAEIGRAKSPLPEPSDTRADWLARCRSDVEITRDVVLELLRWLERSDLGSFRVTGAAQASAAFRHRFLRPKSILIHNDDAARSAERTASWTGRCEVWQHGPTAATIHEWDYELAYATIALDAQLPAQLLGARDKIDRAAFDDLSRSRRVLCEVEIETEAPVVPTALHDKILWPVGSFPSLLWDEEIALAISTGASIRFGRAWIYQPRPLLRDWARWIIESLQGPEPETDPLARIVLKTWSRSLIGRFGLRHPSWSDFGKSPVHDLLYMPYLDLNDSSNGVLFQVGTDLLDQSGLNDAPNSAPAIMSAIMASARVRLWKTLTAIDFDDLYYCDTDSLLVGSSASAKLSHLSTQPEFDSLRLKTTYQGGDFHAPRSIMLAQELRAAGIPKAARLHRGRYLGEVWQSIAQAMSSNSPDAVSVRSMSWAPHGDDFRRAHLENGATAPYLV